MKNNTEKFSLTEMIEEYFNNNMPLPSFFSSINIHEVTEKNIVIEVKDRPYPITIKESLAENIVAHLPLKAYQEIFSLDWFFVDNREHKTVYAAIKNKHLDMLEFCLDKAQEQLIENKKGGVNKSEDNSSRIINHFLSPIRKSLGNYYFEQMDYTKVEMAQFYKIWKKAIYLIEEHEPFRYYGQETSDNPNILELYVKKLGYNEKKDDLFKRLSSDAIFIDIFKDLFQFLSHDEKRDLCLYADEGIAENALYYRNKKLIELLEKEQLILPENYLNVMENEFSLTSHSRKKTNDTWFYKKADTVLNSQDKLKVKGSTLLAMLIDFKDKEIIINDIFDKYPQLQIENLLDYPNTSLAELNFINSIVNTVDDNKYFFISIDTEEKKVFNLLPLLNERFGFKQSFNSIEDLEHNHFYLSLRSNVQEANKLKTKEASAFILEKFMDLKLAPKNVLPKIKI